VFPAAATAELVEQVEIWLYPFQRGGVEILEMQARQEPVVAAVT
jgi:hypothetical protein